MFPPFFSPGVNARARPTINSAVLNELNFGESFIEVITLAIPMHLTTSLFSKSSLAEEQIGLDLLSDGSGKEKRVNLSSNLWKLKYLFIPSQRISIIRID